MKVRLRTGMFPPAAGWPDTLSAQNVRRGHEAGNGAGARPDWRARSSAETVDVGRGFQEYPGTARNSREGIHGDDGLLRRLAKLELHRLSCLGKRQQLGTVCRRHAHQEYGAPHGVDDE